MDRSLLTLWNTVPSGNIKQEEIATIIGFSTKQTKRYLQRWSSEGWIKFISGKGRGNSSQLTWLKNVEACFEEQVMQILEHESAEISSKYLMFDWSTECRQRLMKKFQNKLGFEQQINDKLIVPRKNPFLTLHPLKAADSHSANIVATVYNRLVSVDENGVVSPELCHSWDMTDSKLRLYLKKDIAFHDGSILAAEDVLNCLRKLKDDPQFRLLCEPIEQIKAITPLIVDITYTAGCSYCLQLLGSMNASIYKEHLDFVYGTGCYYVEENGPSITTLVAFKDFYGERPLLDTIEFVQVPEDFENVYRTSSNQQTYFPIESDSGFGVVLISPQLDIDQRHYLHYIISKYRHEINTADDRLLPNEEGCLIGISTPYELHNIPRPKFKKPIILKLVKYTNKSSHWLKEILTKNGIPVDIITVSFKDNLLNRELNPKTDLYIHGEIFEMNQNYSFFHFLMNGYSPLATVLKGQKKYQNKLKEYAITPFEEWTALNKEIDRMLIEDSLVCPLYYSKRHIPFSADLMNIKIKHFGFVDYSKLWVKPNIPLD